MLAPLLMMGAALGGVESIFLPHLGLGLLASFEYGSDSRRNNALSFHGDRLRHRIDSRLQYVLLPLLVACFIAHLFTVLTLKRSILTEKIARQEVII